MTMRAGFSAAFRMGPIVNKSPEGHVLEYDKLKRHQRSPALGRTCGSV